MYALGPYGMVRYSAAPISGRVGRGEAWGEAAGRLLG
jgi:hypothetical protein